MSDTAQEWPGEGAGLYSGMAFLCLGGIFAFVSLDHPFGSTDEIGPGFMPLVLSGLLVLLGLAQIAAGAKGLRAAWRKTAASGPARLDRRALRAVLCVTLALVSFAATVRLGGLVVAIPLLVACAAVADDDLSWSAAALTAAVLTVSVAVIFVIGFGVTLPILPALGR